MRKLLLSICCVAVIFTARSQDYVITRLGVGTDSTKLNTRAIQAVIDKAHENGGGTIVVPKGVFLTGALFFKPDTRLRLLEGAMLKGSDNIADYPLIPSRMEGKNLLYYAALINAYYVDSFNITGPGTINGNGHRFWKTFWDYRDSVKKTGRAATNLEVHRPRLLFIWGCNNVNIQNVKLHNSGFWTTHLYQCNNVLIENCDIRSPYKPVAAPSTDGIDIDVCKKVTVRNCYISVNDDAVCIKGGKGPDAHKRGENGVVEDILIENCTFGESHGTLTLGSESIHARNITMRNCKVDNSCPILRLKMRPDTYQVFENIHISNITGRCGTIISVNPWKQFFSMGGSTEKPYGTVRNITFSDIDVKCKTLGEIEGNAADSINNIVFKNVKAVAETPTLKNKYPGIKMENVIVNAQPFVIK
jgi:polygalacturonase